MRYHATPSFWACYNALSPAIRQLADQAYARLKDDPYYPAPHFKKVGRFWSARIGNHHRAPATEGHDGLVWFWIDSHAEYDTLVG